MGVSRLASIPFILFTTAVPGLRQPGAVLSVVPFLSLARELANLILPVRPRLRFRQDLEFSLLAAARRQNAHIALTGFAVSPPLAGPRFDAFERRWVIGAAAAAVGSAVSIAGLLAYMLYRRGDRAA